MNIFIWKSYKNLLTWNPHVPTMLNTIFLLVLPRAQKVQIFTSVKPPVLVKMDNWQKVSTVTSRYKSVKTRVWLLQNHSIHIIWYLKLRIIIVREYNITEFIQCYSETRSWGLFHRSVIDSLTWSLYTLWGRLFFFENKMSLNQFSWKRKWKILC